MFRDLSLIGPESLEQCRLDEWAIRSPGEPGLAQLPEDTAKRPELNGDTGRRIRTLSV